MITFIKVLDKVFEAETFQTRRRLEKVPNDKFDWKPNQKKK
jgi:hypothetical protein